MKKIVLILSALIFNLNYVKTLIISAVKVGFDPCPCWECNITVTGSVYYTI